MLAATPSAPRAFQVIFPPSPPPASDCPYSDLYKPADRSMYSATYRPDATGQYDSMTYLGPHDAVVVVTRWHYHKQEQIPGQVRRETEGADPVQVPLRCGSCAPTVDEERKVFDKHRGGVAIVRIDKQGFTMIETSQMVDALNVECILFSRPLTGSAPKAPAN